MVGFIHVAVAVLSVLSGAHSAPVTNCENLIRPITIPGRDQLMGKWMYLAESTTIKGSKLLTKMFVESASAKITAANESDAINVFNTQKSFGYCYSLSTKMTIVNNTLTMEKPFTVSEVFLNTSCSDCHVAYSHYTIGGSSYRGLQLMSRRNKGTAAELEEFTKQVECLNLPPPAVLSGEDYCPDDSASQDTEVIDLTNVMDDIDSDVLDLVDRVLSSDNAVKSLIKLISSSVAGLKEH